MTRNLIMDEMKKKDPFDLEKPEKLAYAALQEVVRALDVQNLGVRRKAVRVILSTRDQNDWPPFAIDKAKNILGSLQEMTLS